MIACSSPKPPPHTADLPDTANLPDRVDVAIVGGGVTGLGVGWRLRQRGLSVLVVDKGEAGRGASWAAAGMLAAGMEAEPGEQALLALTLEAQARWPAFRDEVEAASDMGIGYRSDGTMAVALSRDDLGRLRNDYEFHRSLGLEMEWLSGAEAKRREPWLARSVAGAVRREADHQVDNRALTAALRTAYLRAGGLLFENREVGGIRIAHGRAAGVEIDGTPVRADAILLAAGAWSRGIAGVPPEALPPVRPIKGQMLAVQMDRNEPILRHVLWGPNHVYLVPRDDGRLLVGATVEEKGFDTTLTAGGMLALLEAAWRVLPGIEELPLIETWVGFRPGSRDDAPIMGETPVPGLHVATGHHRNGILLAPVTADEMAASIASGVGGDLIRPFGPARFAKAPVTEALPGAASGRGAA